MIQSTNPDADPRLISDHGSQFRSNDFKRFVTEIEATHVMTSPYYPQSNGKLERFHLTLKKYAYKKLPLDWEDGKRIIGEMIEYYNAERFHSAIDFVTPMQCLRGERDAIVKQRKTKHLETAKNRIAYWSEKSLEERAACAAKNGLGEAEATRAEERVAQEYSSQATARGSEPNRSTCWKPHKGFQPLAFKGSLPCLQT